MPCIHDADGNHVGHLCDGGPKTWLRTMRKCPVCKRLRPLTGFYQEWYGTTWTCCGCGDSWCDGELLARPFRPRWRQDAVKKALSHWSDVR